MNTVLKYPGSKWSTANWIISNFPVSGAIFFNKKRSIIETINDIDGRVVNLFKVIREHPEELKRLVELTPWSREEYRRSYEESDDNLEDARRFLIRMWMAIGAKSSDNTGWRHYIEGGKTATETIWMNYDPPVKQLSIEEAAHA